MAAGKGACLAMQMHLTRRDFENLYVRFYFRFQSSERSSRAEVVLHTCSKSIIVHFIQLERVTRLRDI